MIYCVVKPELEEELYEKLLEHYKDNEAVSVIIDRRVGPDRRARAQASEAELEQRKLRDRRRPRVPGTFANSDIPE